MLHTIRNLWDNVVFLTKAKESLGMITERLEAECLARRIASANEWAVTNSKLTQVFDDWHGITDVNQSRATLDDSTEKGENDDQPV